MDGFIGEIRLMAWSFTPIDWLPCDGRTVPLGQYQALAAVIGKMYGGDGTTVIGLPDLRGRVAVGAGNDPLDGFDPTIASNTGGAESVTLTLSDLAPHNHTLSGATLPQAKRVATAGNNYISSTVNIPTSGPSENAAAFAVSQQSPVTATLNQATLSAYSGLGGGHENRQPFLGLAYFICTNGVFPLKP